VSEYDHEPVRGLPEVLPQDEQILWQDSPDWRAMAANALHLRLAAVYFGGIALWGLMRGDMNTAIGVSVLGLFVIAMSLLFLWGVARTTVYTLTNRRIVLRIGVALNKCINLPLAEIESANLKALGGGHGSIVLALKGMPRIGYVMLWPHVRSLRFVRPQPMLRAVPDAAAVAALLFRAVKAVQPAAVRAAPPERAAPKLDGVTA
jgi:cytochrome b561